MIIVKKIIMFSFIFLILISSTSCFKNNFEEQKEEMMKYLSEKYNEEFEYVNMNTQTWDKDYTEMILKSKKFSEYSVIVHKDNKTNIITDNYLAISHNNEIENTIENLANKVYENIKVFNDPTRIPLSDNIDVNITTDELLTLLITDITIFIYDENYINKDIDVKTFYEILKDKKYPLNFTLCYVSEDTFVKINRNNYTSFLTSQEILMRGDFVISKTLELSYSHWKN